jgi:hypothetical protein
MCWGLAHSREITKKVVLDVTMYPQSAKIPHPGYFTLKILEKLNAEQVTSPLNHALQFFQ